MPPCCQSAFRTAVGCMPSDARQSSARDQAPECLVCGTPTKQTCRKCLVAPFCSDECNRIGRKNHKAACRHERQDAQGRVKASACGTALLAGAKACRYAKRKCCGVRSMLLASCLASFLWWSRTGGRSLDLPDGGGAVYDWASAADWGATRTKTRTSTLDGKAETQRFTEEGRAQQGERTQGKRRPKRGFMNAARAKELQDIKKRRDTELQGRRQMIHAQTAISKKRPTEPSRNSSKAPNRGQADSRRVEPPQVAQEEWAQQKVPYGVQTESATQDPGGHGHRRWELLDQIAHRVSSQRDAEMQRQFDQQQAEVLAKCPPQGEDLTIVRCCAVRRRPRLPTPDYRQWLEGDGHHVRALRDLRRALWPHPDDAHLQSHRHAVWSDGGGAAGVEPLAVDWINLAFDLKAIPRAPRRLRRAVAWSVRRLCRRLPLAPGPAPGPEGQGGSASAAGPEPLAWLELRLTGPVEEPEGDAAMHPPQDDLPHLGADESYDLVLEPPPGQSILTANSRHGLNRGLETLIQVLDALSESGQASAMAAGEAEELGEEGLWAWAPGVLVQAPTNPTAARWKPLEVLALHIKDRPRHPWRGLMVDTARHYLPVETLKHVLSNMAANKMNVLHWHLSDSESFPLILSEHPELSLKGAFGKDRRYSEEQVKELVDFASRLSIRVVPGLSMPARAGIWGRAWPEVVTNCSQAALLKSGCTRPEAFCRVGFGTFRYSEEVDCDGDGRADPSCWDAATGDTAFRSSRRGCTGQVRDGECEAPPRRAELDLSKPQALELARAVLRGAARLFPDAFLHLGGQGLDESCVAAQTGLRKAWQRFLDAVSQEATSLGRRVVLWQEALDAKLLLPKDVVLHTWRCASTGSHSGRSSAVTAARQGFSVLQSTCWFLDEPAGWREFYGFGTVDLQEEGLGSSVDRQKLAQKLLGGEAALWTAKVDFTNLDCRLWPRASTVAEKLWARRDWTRTSITGDPLQEVRARLMLQAHRMQRLFGFNPRPLQPDGQVPIAVPGGNLLSDQGRDTMARTCPLLKVPSSQTSFRDPLWVKVAAHSFRAWEDDNATEYL